MEVNNQNDDDVKASEQVEEESEITPYEAMDLVDEVQMIDELEGKLTPEDMQTFVYSFPDKTTGKVVTGLSWKGTKATWWELNKKNLTNMTVTDKMVITQGDGYVDVAVYAYDEMRKIGAWGMARGYTKQQTRNGAIEDRFASAKAMSKAQRNALNQLFPSELVAKMIQEWIKKGNSKSLTPQVVSYARTQSNAYGGGNANTYTGTSQNKYPTQEELMKKYGMDLSQKIPNCPTCGNPLKLVQRKDGSGIFWSCVNWKSGCKGFNVDQVDIDGVITIRQ